MEAKKDLAVQQLEGRLQPYRLALGSPQPAGGWIRAIREALGMTQRQLAQRAGRRPQTILDLQAREAAQTIQLNSLRELANAMDCEVVYAIVPRKPLATMLEERARSVARETLRRTGHSMALERQALGVREQERALEREVGRLLAGSRRKLWE
jgi:predicted DNA-binding mobile mystery protein A